MADCLPIASSGPREPTQRPRPIPKIVREALMAMVWGNPDDEESGPVNFIDAAKSIGMRPDTLRRYLHRPGVIAFLRAERRAFREAVLAGNEAALQRVRDGDKHGNPMAIVAAARALSNLDQEEERRPASGRQTEPGLTVVIYHPPAPTTDITPSRSTDLADTLQTRPQPHRITSDQISTFRARPHD